MASLLGKLVFSRRINKQRTQNLATGRSGSASSNSKHRHATRPEPDDDNEKKNSDKTSATLIRDLLDDEHKCHQVVVWIKPACPYCHATVDLLQQKLKGLDVKVHDLFQSPQGALVHDELARLTSGQRTVPYIFIHGQPIVGGNSQLQELYHHDQLEALLFPQLSVASDKGHGADRQQQQQQQEEYVRAVWKGRVVAECEESRIRVVGVLHPQYYFPADSILALQDDDNKKNKNNKVCHLEPIDDDTTPYYCGSKGGEATYYSLLVAPPATTVGEKKNPDTKRTWYKYPHAAWSYPNPTKAAELKDHVCFDSEVAILKGREQIYPPLV